MNVIVKGLAILTLLGCDVMSVWAGSAVCIPSDGVGAVYHNNSSKDIQAQDNAMGYSLDQEMDSGGEGYHIACDCTEKDATGTSGVLLMYMLDTPLASGHSTGYYKLNDHLDVMTSITLPQNGNVRVPTSSALGDKTHHRDSDNNGVCTVQNTQETLTTGSQGQITLYITTPFIGQLIIPPTEIAAVYASSGTSVVSAPPRGNPIAHVWLSGTLTVPQSCEINKGETISVNLGYISAGKFTQITQPPAGYTPPEIAIEYDCTRNGLPVIPNGDKLTMMLEGNDVQGEYYLVARRRPSDNKPDVGIEVKNETGTSIPFISGVLPMNQNGIGRIVLRAYPINLLGGLLDSGDFDAIATLRVDIK
jgi:type 1 fimbria pilin